MLFLDVTQSCRSSNNSGIQVVTRNLFRELDKLTETTPMIWDPRLRSYAQLNRQERKKLANPFPKNYRPRTRPNKEENPIAKELLASLLRFNRRISLESKPDRQNLLILPEVFRDNRVHSLSKRLHTNLRRGAIFYDANVLRKPKYTPAIRARNFNEYLDFLSGCDAISCISQESKKVFGEHCEESNSSPEVKVHPLPAEPPTSQPFMPLHEPPLILFVSTLAYNKNHLVLLEATEKLWNEGLVFKLELVGQADPSWTPRIQEQLKVLSSKKRPVNWLQHIDQETLEKRYATSLFTVYPSLFEGCGLPILESLVRGKPCICGINGALGEVARGGGCLTIHDQRDPEALANGIRQLLEDTTLRRKLIDETAMRNFGNWQEYASSLLSFFFQE